jgi:hypothetical protein
MGPYLAAGKNVKPKLNKAENLAGHPARLGTRPGWAPGPAGHPAEEAPGHGVGPGNPGWFERSLSIIFVCGTVSFKRPVQWHRRFLRSRADQ